MMLKESLKIVLAVLLLSFVASGHAAAEKKPQAEFISPQVAKKLEDVYKIIDEERYNDAITSLKETETYVRERGSQYELAVVLQIYGYVYIGLEKYEQAAGYYEKALALNAFPEEPEKQATYMLAQVYNMLGRYDDVLKLMLNWLKDAVNPPGNAYFIVATAYAAQDKFREAYPYVVKAVETAAKNGENKTEAWYQMKAAIEFELERFKDAAATLEILVANWPGKKDYWIQLAGVSIELDNERRALAVLDAAYGKGMVTEERDIVNLVRLFMRNDVPYNGAVILAKEIDAERVEKTEKNYELLSQAWSQAREFRKAIDSLGEAAERSEEGHLYLRMARYSMQINDWAGARKAASKALEKGGLEDKDKGQAWLVVGSAAAEAKDYDAAIEAFGKARSYENTRSIAGSWLQYVETERAIARQ